SRTVVNTRLSAPTLRIRYRRILPTYHLTFADAELVMSFGFGLGDLIAISKLAWVVFRACKESSDHFAHISAEVSSLHIVLLEIQEEYERRFSLLKATSSISAVDSGSPTALITISHST